MKISNSWAFISSLDPNEGWFSKWVWIRLQWLRLCYTTSKQIGNKCKIIHVTQLFRLTKNKYSFLPLQKSKICIVLRCLLQHSYIKNRIFDFWFAMSRQRRIFFGEKKFGVCTLYIDIHCGFAQKRKFWFLFSPVARLNLNRFGWIFCRLTGPNSNII